MVKNEDGIPGQRDTSELIESNSALFLTESLDSIVLTPQEGGFFFDQRRSNISKQTQLSNNKIYQ